MVSPELTPVLRVRSPRRMRKCGSLHCPTRQWSGTANAVRLLFAWRYCARRADYDVYGQRKDNRKADLAASRSQRQITMMSGSLIVYRKDA